MFSFFGIINYFIIYFLFVNNWIFVQLFSRTLFFLSGTFFCIKYKSNEIAKTFLFIWTFGILEKYYLNTLLIKNTIKTGFSCEFQEKIEWIIETGYKETIF